MINQSATPVNDQNITEAIVATLMAALPDDTVEVDVASLRIVTLSLVQQAMVIGFGVGAQYASNKMAAIMAPSNN